MSEDAAINLLKLSALIFGVTFAIDKVFYSQPKKPQTAEWTMPQYKSEAYHLHG